MNIEEPNTIMAIVPRSNRIALALFVNKRLTYFHVSTLISKKHNRLITLRRLIEDFVDKYSPTILAIESFVYVQQQTSRLHDINAEIIKTAKRLNLETHFCSPKEIRVFIANDTQSNKFTIANALIILFPELRNYLEPNKSVQPHGFLVFNAVALGLFALNTDASPFY
jgi:Holliday junction resolvasome RuvABC endonuclease subunit